jgi:hypothetical protein
MGQQTQVNIPTPHNITCATGFSRLPDYAPSRLHGGNTTTEEEVAIHKEG